MSSIALRFRAQWRQRWGTLFALTLLVGVVGATVLTTVAGARRTRSVVERTDERMKIPDAFALIESNSFAEVDAILDLPVVASGERLAIFTAFAELGYLPMVGSVDGVLGSELQYDRIIRGRRPHPNAADEVALPLGTAEEFGLDVGDSLQFHSPGPEQVRCYIDSEYGATDVCREELEIFASATPDWELLGGPSFELEVVGVTRQLDSTGAGEDLQNTFLPQGFYDAYRTTIHYIPGVAARYEAGVNDQQFEAGMGEIVGQASMPDISYSSALLDSLNSTAATLANGLLVFAGVAAVAGLVAIAQALARQAAAGAADGRVLASLGVTRAGRVVDSLVPLVPVALCGSVLAVVGAGLVSPIMPIGAAREVELARGFDFDAVVLVAGGALLAGSVIVAALVASAWMGRTRSRARVARFSAGVPASVPMGLGVRWALQPERAVPIRSAISGVALGVAGIVAVAGFSEGLERLTHDPVRTGWGWDVTISGDNVVEQDALETAGVGDRSVEDARAARILADPAVDELSLAWIGLRASVEGRAVSAYASRPYRGDIGFVVVDGRAPQGLDEVALGAKTMRRAGTGLGDEVRVGDQTMDVVGQAVFPDIGDGYTLADGALFTEDAMVALDLTVGNQWYKSFAVNLDDGADRDGALARLAALNADEPPEESVQPTELRQLGQLNDLPAYLAMFLFVVAVLAVAHALFITVRRRRHDVGILRSLGATRGQSASTIAWQASTIAFVGVAIGLPCGLLLGRWVWAAVADAYGVADDAAWPVFAIVVALPVTVLVANAIAWWPGRRAARIRPSEALRAE